ncbi:unnamed protein product [Trichogramma brassicae]|uniref:Uncharacterized protein n=1 Tax=Trichogramma brassicae TaxID=86971 RepID=A0A6H5ITT4_9HYME|nr:unnamed protein product [Trichogramma brassicae]
MFNIQKRLKKPDILKLLEPIADSGYTLSKPKRHVSNAGARPRADKLPGEKTLFKNKVRRTEEELSEENNQLTNILTAIRIKGSVDFGRAGPRCALGSNRSISSARSANARHTCPAAQFNSHSYTAMHANTRARALMPRTEHTCTRLRREMADANWSRRNTTSGADSIRRVRGEKREAASIHRVRDDERETENGADPIHYECE